MTDRLSGFIVALDKDMREDDAAITLGAIMQIKGVMRVEPVVVSPQAQIIDLRLRTILRDKLFAMAKDL